MNLLAATVAMWGPELLSRLPNSFDSFAAGKGQPWYKNRRVLIIGALILLCSMSQSLKWRLAVIPLSALLTLTITQHALIYNDVAFTESYPLEGEGNG